jgi:hypothetical protein
MPPPKRIMAHLEDVIRVIFAELDQVWLKSMWEEDGKSRVAWSRSSTCFILLRQPWLFWCYFMTISIKL